VSGYVRLYTEDARGRRELRELRGRPVDDLAVHTAEHRLNMQARDRNGTVAGERNDGL
jgi:hypothetical protein